MQWKACVMCIKMTREATLVCLMYLLACCAKCQELEPRAYAALPKNLNAVAVVYGLSKGNIVADPSHPVDGLKITINSLTGSYIRTFGLADKLARVQVVIPFVDVLGKLQINGRDTTGSRIGFGD